MQKLSFSFDALQSSISQFEKTNVEISSVSVGWHIEHSLLVIIKIADQLLASDVILYKPTFNKWKTLVFFLNKLPRGKAKAPKRVLPDDICLLENLNKLSQTAASKMHELKETESGKYFEHPVFGHLNLKQTIKFLAIHTNHHNKIIKDILHQ